MSVPLDSSVVAILRPQGGIVGTGFVAAESLIVTCAHVVSAAGGQPGSVIAVRFHLTRDVGQAEVALWDAVNDLATLNLSGGLPAGVEPVSLGESAGTEGQAFRAFGYPDVGMDGLYADGTTTGRVRGPKGQDLLQVKSSQLAQGFSGGPVLVGGKVIGIVTAVYHADRTLKNFDTAWAIPAELIPHTPTPPHAFWPLGHSFATSPNFTGRADERRELSAWLSSGPTVLVLRALGGFGKSALAWHWLLNDVDKSRWPRALWWNFYDVREFETFLAEALPHFDVDPHGLGPRQQADQLLEQLSKSGVLLVLDGFERALRAFSGMNAAYQGDEPHPPPASPPPPSPERSSGEGGGRGVGEAERDCISPIAEHFLRSAASRPGLRGRVLITTRLHPRVLEGHDLRLLQYCREIELTTLSPADAVALFHAEGVRGTRAEIEAACAPYGYHPLSLRLLAGLIVNDLRQPGDIAVAGRLDVSGDLIQSQHHVLEQAYDSLTPERRQLLSTLACFRSPMLYEAIQAIASETPSPSGRGAGGEGELDAHLRDLISRGLLHRTGDPPGRPYRYDLHPIVRRYAYDRLTDKTAAHTRLRAYFVVIKVPKKFKTLDDLTPLLELYHHTVHAGQYDEAFKLFHDRISRSTYYQFGAYELQIELLRVLFPDGEDKPPRLKNEGAQAWTLTALANSYGQSGQPRRAVPLFERHTAIRERQGDKKNIAVGLGNLAIEQMAIGALRAAEANHRRRIALCHEIKGDFNEAIGHRELGRLLAYRGEWDESAQELAQALELFEKENQVQSQGIVWAYQALRALLIGRTSSPTPLSETERESAPPPSPVSEEGPRMGVEVLSSARRALELAEQHGLDYPVERDYVLAHWLLGAAYRASGNYGEAERHLTEALTRCRANNTVEAEADILIDIARLRAAQGEPEEALRLAQEALEIAERCGYVLQGADAHLELAKLAISRDRSGLADPTGLALQHAREARKLATCDGAPYTYKVAYDEAGALLEQLGEKM